MKLGERIEPLHARPDEEFARSVGLPGIILHGLYSMALVARAANEAAGGDPRSLRSLAVQMRDIAVMAARRSR